LRRAQQAVRAQERAEHARAVGVWNESGKRPSSGRFPGGGGCVSSHGFAKRPSSGKLGLSPAAATYSAAARVSSAQHGSAIGAPTAAGWSCRSGDATPGRSPHGVSGASNGSDPKTPSSCKTPSRKGALGTGASSKCLRFANDTAGAPSALPHSTPRHGADAARRALETNRFACTAVGPCMSEQI